jgi:hypothetical protein
MFPRLQAVNLIKKSGNHARKHRTGEVKFGFSGSNRTFACRKFAKPRATMIAGWYFLRKPQKEFISLNF